MWAIEVELFETIMELMVRLLSTLPSWVILNRRFMVQQDVAVAWDMGRPCMTVGDRVLRDTTAKREISLKALREVEEVMEVSEQIKATIFPALSSAYEKAKERLRGVLFKHARVLLGGGCIRDASY